MSNLKEYGKAPEPFRTREDEPEPLRAFTGWFNGNKDLQNYRACLIRLPWDERFQQWLTPDTCWGVSLCERDAYPYRWHAGPDWIMNPNSEAAVPEVAEMRLCMTCARHYKDRTGKEFEG